MSVYATVSDVQDRWRPLTPGEQARAMVLLDDAEATLGVEVSDLAVKVAAGAPSDAVVRMVLCGMVKRAMVAAADGVSTQQETTGPFAQSLTFANPMGNLYLTKADRRVLGIGSGRAFTIDTAPVGSGVTSAESIYYDWDSP